MEYESDRESWHSGNHITILCPHCERKTSICFNSQLNRFDKGEILDRCNVCGKEIALVYEVRMKG